MAAVLCSTPLPHALRSGIVPHSHFLKNWTLTTLPSPLPCVLHSLCRGAHCHTEPGGSHCWEKQLLLLFLECWDQLKATLPLAEVNSSVCQFCPGDWETEGAPCHRITTQRGSQSSQMGPKEAKSCMNSAQHKLSLGALPVFRTPIVSRLKFTFLLAFPPASFVSAPAFSVDVV